MRSFGPDEVEVSDMEQFAVNNILDLEEWGCNRVVVSLSIMVVFKESAVLVVVLSKLTKARFANRLARAMIGNIKVCLKTECLAAAESQFEGFIAFANEELAGIREITEHTTNPIVWKAVMKLFDNDCANVLRGIGAKWDRISGYVLPHE